MDFTFTVKEAFLGLSTVITWADGDNQKSEMDALVQMMEYEKISSSDLDAFKVKYDQINDFETVFLMSVRVLQNQPIELKYRSLAWMWSVANVADENSEGRLDFIEDVWENDPKNVDLDELRWINRAKRLLAVDLDGFKKTFKKLPKIQRII